MARLFAEKFLEQIASDIQIASAFFVAVVRPVVGTPAGKQDRIAWTA